MKHPYDKVFDRTRDSLDSTITAFETFLQDRRCSRARNQLCVGMQDIVDALCGAAQDLMGLGKVPAKMLALAESSLAISCELLSLGKHLDRYPRRRGHMPLETQLADVSTVWALIQRIRLQLKQAGLTVDLRPVTWPGH